MYGSATMLRNEFAKTIQYPVEITADCDYPYIMAKQVDGFAYEKRSQILYRTAATLQEMRRQGTRFHTERQALVTLFGQEVLTMHALPLQYKVKGLIRMFMRHPIYTVLALGVLLSFRLFPVEDTLMKQGMWKTAISTKLPLVID